MAEETGYVVISRIGRFPPHTFGTFIYSLGRAKEVAEENNRRKLRDVRYTVARVTEEEK